MTKREILTSCKVLFTKLVYVISSWFEIKMLSKNTGFYGLKCQLKQKELDTACFRRFSEFQPTREGANKVNLSSFRLKNFFKFVLAWLARQKQNILTPRPCLHSLMQTRLSVNQSARTRLSYFINSYRFSLNMSMIPTPYNIFYRGDRNCRWWLRGSFYSTGVVVHRWSVIVSWKILIH